MKHYWINIDSYIDRKENVEKQFKNLNIDNERISAVTPETLKNYNIKYYDNKVNTEQQYSCIISHLKAIKKGYDDGDDYFCICEDDFTLKKKLDFNKIFQYIENIEKEKNEKVELLQLHVSNAENIIKLYNNFINSENLHNAILVKRTIPEYKEAWGTAYYLLSRQGAKKILNYTKYENNNVDLKIYYEKCLADFMIYVMVKTYMLAYPILVSNINLGSCICDKYLHIHEYGNNINREIWKINDKMYLLS
jgi:GR25 family glycosyltransferase involved in LPS biosynthesis